VSDSVIDSDLEQCEKISYNSRDIEFFLGDYFFGTPCKSQSRQSLFFTSAQTIHYHSSSQEILSGQRKSFKLQASPQSVYYRQIRRSILDFVRVTNHCIVLYCISKIIERIVLGLV